MIGTDDKISRQTVITRINSLRGLFAIMIVIGHCSMYFEKELWPLMIIHKFNMVSVCFFFMASGISLSYNMVHKKDYLKGFIRNKVLLLLIFAFIAQLIGCILRIIVLDETFAFDLRILTGWNWYIYEMAVLYLIFYMVNKYARKPLAKELLIWVSSFIICLATLYFFRYGRWEGWTGAYYFSTLSFPFGITLYFHFDDIQSRILRHPIIHCLILLCIAACTCVSLTMPNDSVFGGIFLRNIMGCCIMSVLFIILNYADMVKIPIAGKVISFLTGFSTEIYLYQFSMLSLWASVYGGLGRRIDLSYTCAVTISTVFLGYVMHFVDSGIAKVVKNGICHVK